MAGGLRVIATERHASSRVDRQLFGRCARQGQPGVVEPLASWDDELVKHHLPRWWQRWGRRWGGTGWVLRWSLRRAQHKAGRTDASRRLAVLRHDQWLDEHLSLGPASPGAGEREKGAGRKM
jgi:preprotein translocase subunit SecA